MATQTAEADNLAKEESIQKDPAIPKVLLKEKHVRFFKQMLNMLPSMYEKLDSSRLTVLYFSLSGKSSIKPLLTNKINKFIIPSARFVQISLVV